MKKIILISLVILSGISLFPIDASAITTGIDQRCFEKQKCIDLRRDTGIDFGNQKPEDGFIQNTETTAACGVRAQGETGQEMGFCLPVGQTETMISFGGKRKFSDIGDFIRYMYKYSIMVAAIISTIMIIVAGFQWSASGGNSSTIQSAQKRIGNAIIGLTIAVLSYTILYWVNPNLVNFRLPQIWLINTIEIVHSPYCSEQPDGTMLAFAQKQDDKSVKAEELQKNAAGPYDKNRFGGACGSNYFILNGGGQTCHGDSGLDQDAGASSGGAAGQNPDGTCNDLNGNQVPCEANSSGSTGPCPIDTHICGPRNDKSGLDSCFEGDVLIRVYEKRNGLFRSTEEWEGFPWVDPKEGELWGICANGTNFEIDTDVGIKDDSNSKDHIFQFSLVIRGGALSVKQTVQSKCNGTDPTLFKGFVFTAEMDENWDIKDEKHYFGTDQRGNALDLGDQEAFDKLSFIIRPEFLIPYKSFVIMDENKNERIGSKVRLKLNVNDIADLDDGDDYFRDKNGNTVRQSLYNQFGAN